MSFNSIGSDLELFAKDKQGNHVALCGKIGGTKQEPLQLADMPRGYMVQEDNVALEFNIPVCVGENDFVRAMANMRQKTASILKSMDLVLSSQASVSFDTKELTHPNALVFGCEPDYDAWSMKENQKPKAKDENLRTAGGHVHVGTEIDMVQGVRLMDLFLGVPSVLLDDSPSSVARRELYGKAGAMRPKEYGFEYRVLSNFWFFKDTLVSWVYNNTVQAMYYNKKITEKEGEVIQECINTGNKDLAQTLIKKYGIPMPQTEIPF